MPGTVPGAGDTDEQDTLCTHLCHTPRTQSQRPALVGCGENSAMDRPLGAWASEDPSLHLPLSQAEEHDTVSTASFPL